MMKNIIFLKLHLYLSLREHYISETKHFIFENTCLLYSTVDYNFLTVVPI